MNIYLVERTKTVGYDQYDAFVVTAKSGIEAMELLIAQYKPQLNAYSPWSKDAKAELIGTTDKYIEPEIILGSFNAG